MKRCNSVPVIKENGVGSQETRNSRQRSPDPPTELEDRGRSRSTSVLDVNAVLQKIEQILGTPSFESCDLNKITKKQLAMLNSLMQEAKLVEQPATLVWKNLSYIKDDRRVFQGISGFAKPGMMICCLGPSSSGISSFLRVLAGRSQKGTIHGEILLNGVRNPGNFRRVVSYVPFEDLHIGHMKVKEAINFSISLRASPRLPQRFLDLHARIILHLLNLGHRSKSLIGGGTLRGISGGERRRLTIGLEVAAGNSIMVMDSPTNGLDSLSAMELTKITRALVSSGRSAIMSISQASPELFGMFDYLICLSQSELIYFGPVTEAVPYMNALGYRKPDFKSVPDFLSDICSDPTAYYCGPDPNRDLILSSPYWNRTTNRFFFIGQDSPDFSVIEGGTVRDLAETFRRSVLHEEVGRVIWHEQTQSQSEYKLPVPLYQLSIAGAMGQALAKNARGILASKEAESRSKVNAFKQFYALLLRAILLNFRERSKSVGRLARAILVSVVTGTVFWQLDDSQAGAMSKLGAISIAAGFLGYDGVDEIPQIFQSRSMFYAQRNAGYFSAFSYFLAHLLADLPIIFAQTSVFSVIIYSMAGMRDGVFSIRFLIFALLILQTAMAGRAWTTFIANLVPNESMAITVAILINDIFWYFQGYFRKSHEIPTGWKWVHYISYFSRLFQALAINELDGLELQCASTDKYCRWTTGNDLLREYYWDTGDTAIGLWLQSFVFLGLFHCFSIACMVMLNFELTMADDKIAESSGRKTQPNEIEMAPGCNSSNPAGTAMISENAIVAVSITADASSSAGSSGICLVARSINYHVGKLHLLQDINLFAKPGMRIALMGASGAGKSTLIDVIAQRKTTGAISGSITINGRVLSKSNLRRHLAYVEQFDALPAFCTVREIVESNAKLRLPVDFSAEKRTQLVDDILTRLRLAHIQDEIADGLSGAVRKKISIAVELASIRPQSGILLCDEPTTGLDSPDAMDIVSCISRVSEHTPVICTIHQPSMELMTSFNWILLLRSGGVPVYFGPTSEVADFCVKSGYPPLQEKDNLAEYVLRTICKGPPEHDSLVLNPLPVPLPETDYQFIPALSKFRSVSWWRKFVVILQRRIRCEARDKYSLYARLACSALFGLILGSIFYQLPLTYAGMMARMSFFFCIVNNVVWAQSAKVSNIVQDRPSYYRELALGMYDESAYYFAWSLAETPFIIAQVVCASFAPYFLAGLSYSPLTFLTYFLTMWLSTEASSGGIHFITALSPNTIIANGIITAVFIVFMAFSGFLLVYSAMPVFGMAFFYISVFRYAVFSSMAGEAGDLSPQAFDCEADGMGMNCRDDVMSQYGIDLGSQWLYLLELCAVLIVFRVLAIIALKTIKHIKR